MEFVRGNNDWSKEYPLEKTLGIGGLKIFITHGHLYNVKYDYDRIIQKGKAINADAVFFGHTHETEEIYSDGMLLLNPGSVSGSGGISSRSTYCSINLIENRLVSRFFTL